MIDDLQQRKDFWGEHHLKKCQGKTTFPEELLTETCRDKCVLEIGPGEGRQFDIASPVAKEYSLADISKIVLARPKYDTCKEKYLLKNYRIDADEKFDVIHAWYVLHHTLPEELDCFMEMVWGNLKMGGTWLFNYAGESGRESIEDGQGTTRYSDAGMEQVLRGNGMELRSRECIAYWSTIVLAEKVR